MITKYLFWFIASLIAATSALCQVPVVLHPRVGETIDIAERSYFGLFPSISSFCEARTYAAENGDMQIFITQHIDSGETRREYTIVADRVVALRNYLGNYETLVDNRIPVNPLIENLVLLPLPEPGKSKKVDIETISGEKIAGRLFCVGTGGLALEETREPYDWRHTDHYVTLSDREISSIHLRGTSLWKTALLGMGIGAGSGALIGYTSADEDGWFGPEFEAAAMGVMGFLAGGMVGAILSAANPSETFAINGDPARYSAYQESLSGRARYSLPPPELTRKLASDTTHATAEIAPAPASAPSSDNVKPRDTAPLSRSVGKIHLYASLPLGTSSAPDDMSQAYSRADFGGTLAGFFGFDPVTYPTSYANGGYWSFQAEYSVAPRICLGVHYSDLRGADVGGFDSENEEVQGETYGAFVKYILAPVAIPGNRFEVAGTAGLDWNTVRGSGSLGYFRDPFVSTNHTYTFEDAAVGLRLELSLDAFLARYLSLQSKVGGAWMGDVTVPGQSVTIVNQSRSLPTHDISLSRYYFTLGLGIHI
jgi:hypothetical protein